MDDASTLKGGLRTGAAASAAVESDLSQLAIDLAITGAFITNCPIDVPIAGYESAQQELIGRLVADSNWQVTPGSHAEGTYHSGGGFSNGMPLVLASRSGEESLAELASLLTAIEPDPSRWFGNHLSQWAPTLRDIRVDLYDLGVAVIRVDAHAQLPRDTDLAFFAAKAKRAVWLRPDPDAGVCSPLVTALRAFCKHLVSEYRDAVLASQLPLAESWSPNPLHPGTAPGRFSAGTDAGRLLWLHPVHTISTTRANHQSLGDQLAPPFHRAIPMHQSLFIPGIGWSAIVLAPDSDSDVIALRLLEMQWAYIALYMEIDRGLLLALDRSRAVNTTHLSLSELEAAADATFAYYLRVTGARARSDSALSDLGGDEQSIWDGMVEVTRLDAILAGVDRKLSVLDRTAARRVQEAAAASQRRTTTILSSLTALTVVTVALALLGSFVGNPSDSVGHLNIRLSTVLLAFALAFILYREAFRRKPRLRRRWRYRMHRRSKYSV